MLNSNWITGPAFLWQEDSCWDDPSSNESQGVLQLSKDDPEVKNSISLATNLEEPFANLLRQLEHFSDFYRAKRAMALCLHYVQKLKRRILHKLPSNAAKSLQQSSPVLNGSQSITVETTKQAEVQIIRGAQTSHFQEELKAFSTA